MNIDIQSRGFSLSAGLRRHVKRRIGFALSTRYDQIKRILVRLSDINGPRGGNDKCCHLHVMLPGQADVVIEDTRSDMYAAIDRAAGRARQTVSRKLARVQSHRRDRSLVPQVLTSSESF